MATLFRRRPLGDARLVKRPCGRRLRRILAAPTGLIPARFAVVVTATGTSFTL